MLKLVGGVILILIGIIGLILPILQGWLFIAAGIIMIAPERGKQFVEKVKMKWAQFRRKKHALHRSDTDRKS